MGNAAGGRAVAWPPLPRRREWRSEACEPLELPLADDLQAVAAGARQTGGAVGEQDHVPHPEVEQDLRADAVVAQDGGAAVGVGLVLAVTLRQPGRIGV